MSVIEDKCGSLIFLRKNGELGSTYPLTTGETCIGSSTDADIRFKIKDDRLEEIHCVIDVTEEGLATLLNKSELAPVSINTVAVRKLKVLCNGDVIDLLGKKIRYANEHVTKQDALKHEKGLATHDKSRQSVAHVKVHSAKKSLNRYPARPSTPKPSFKKNMEMERPQTISKLLSLTPQPSRRNKIRRLSMDNPKRLSRSLKVSERDIRLTSNVVFSSTIQKETTPSKMPTSKISENRTDTPNLPAMDKLKTPKNTPFNKSKLLASGKIETPKPGTKRKSITTPCTNTETPKMTPSRKSQSKIVTSALKPEKIGPRLKIADSIQKRRKSTSSAKSLDQTPPQRRKSESNLTRDDLDRRATRNVPDRRSRLSRNLKRRITSVRTEDSSDVSLHISSVSTTSPIGSLSDLSSSESEFEGEQVAKESRKSLRKSQKMEIPTRKSLKNRNQEKPRSSGLHSRSVRETLLLEKDSSSISSEEENQEYPKSIIHGSKDDSVQLKSRRSTRHNEENVSISRSRISTQSRTGEKLNDTPDLKNVSFEMEEPQPLRRSSTSRFSIVSALNESSDSSDVENPPALSKVEKRQSLRSSKGRSPDESSETLNIENQPQHSEKRQSSRRSNVSRSSKGAASDESSNSVDFEGFPGQSEVERRLSLHNSNISKSSEALDESCDSLELANLSGQREVEKRQNFSRSRSSKVTDLDESRESLDIENRPQQSDVEKRQSLRHSNVSRSSKVKDLNESSDSSSLENHPEQREVERRQSLRRSKVSRSSEALDESCDSLNFANLSGQGEVEKRQTFSRSRSSKVRDLDESSESLDIENRPPQSDVEKRQSSRHSNVSRSSKVKDLNESSDNIDLENRPEQSEVENRRSLRRSKVSRSSEALDESCDSLNVANLSGQGEVEKRQTFSRSRSSKVRDLDESSESLDIENRPPQSDVEKRQSSRNSNVSRSSKVKDLNESSDNIDLENRPEQSEVENRRSLRRSKVSRSSEALDESCDSLNVTNLSVQGEVEKRQTFSRSRSSKIRDLNESSKSLDIENRPQQSDVEKQESLCRSNVSRSKGIAVNESSNSLDLANLPGQREVEERQSLRRSNVSRSSKAEALNESGDSFDLESLPPQDKVERRQSLSHLKSSKVIDLDQSSKSLNIENRTRQSEVEKRQSSGRSRSSKVRELNELSESFEMENLPLQSEVDKRKSLNRSNVSSSSEVEALSGSSDSSDLENLPQSHIEKHHSLSSELLESGENSSASSVDLSRSFLSSTSSSEGSRRSSRKSGRKTEDSPMKSISIPRSRSSLKRTYLNESKELSIRLSKSAAQFDVSSGRRSSLRQSHNTNDVATSDNITRRVSQRRSSTTYCKTCVSVAPQRRSSTVECSNIKLWKQRPAKGPATSDDDANDSEPPNAPSVTKRLTSRKSSRSPLSSSWQNNTTVIVDDSIKSTPENNTSIIILDTPLDVTKRMSRQKLSKTLNSSIEDPVELTTPKSAIKGRRYKSVPYRPIVEDITPVTPQDMSGKKEGGFKTPVNTPGLFENIKKSAIKSRSRRKLSSNLSEELDKAEPTGVRKRLRQSGDSSQNSPKRRKVSDDGTFDEDPQNYNDSFASFGTEELFDDSDAEEYVAPNTPRDFKNLTDKPLINDPQAKCLTEPRKRKMVSKRLSLGAINLDSQSSRNDSASCTPFSNSATDESADSGRSSRGVPSKPQKENVAHKTPQQSFTNDRKVKKLVGKSPKNDLTDVRGLRNLMQTPRPAPTPKNDLTNIIGVKKLLSTPKVPKSPKNDLRNVPNLRRIMSPRHQNSPKNDLSDVAGLKKLFSTPRKQNEPKNDLTNVAGVKKLLSTPRTQNSPRNDLSRVPNLGKFMYPKSQNDPRNSLDDVEGVADIFSMLEAQANQSDIENNEYFVNKPQKTYRGKSLSPLARKAMLYGGDDDQTLSRSPCASPRIEKWLRDQAVVNLERVDAKTLNKSQPEGTRAIGAKEDGVIRDIEALATEPPRTVRSRRRGKPVEVIDSISEFMESAPPLPVKRSRTRKAVQEEGKAEQIGEVDSTTEGEKPVKSKRGRGRKVSSNIREENEESKKVKKQDEIVVEPGSDEIVESSVGRRALRRRIQKSDSECEQIEQPVRRGGGRKLLPDPDCQEVTKKAMVATTMGGRQKKIENAEEVGGVKEIPGELGDGRRKRVHFEDDTDSIVNAATPEPAKKSRTKLKRDLLDQEPSTDLVVEESVEAPVKKGRRGQKKEVEEDEDVQDGHRQKRGKGGRPKKVAADENNLENLQDNVKKELKRKVADKAPERSTRARTRRSPLDDGSDLEKECEQKPSPPKRTRRKAVVENEEEKDVGEEKEEVRASKRPVRTLRKKVIEEDNHVDSPRMTRRRKANFKKYGSEFTELGTSSKEDNVEEATRAVGRSRRTRK